MVSSLTISDPEFCLEQPTPLSENEVHLWRVALDGVTSGEEKWRHLLSPDERTRAARFHFPEHRQHYTATRALLRTILASYVGSDPAKLVFCYSEKEKPSLKSSEPADRVEFNVSHSGSTALLAFARGRLLGVDVEKIREDFDPAALAHRYFSDSEREQLAALSASERCLGFFRCWTRKEAFIKAIGAGLSFPLHQFDVSLRCEDQDGLLATRPDTAEAKRWSLRDVPAGDGYVAALCVQGHGWQLKV